MKRLRARPNMRAIYKNEDPLAGQEDLEVLARELLRQHPGAAGSFFANDWQRPSPWRVSVCNRRLARTLRSTNPIESMIEICRDHSSNVKRSRDLTIVRRGCGAGMAEAKKQFRRVNGYISGRCARHSTCTCAESYTLSLRYK